MLPCGDADSAMIDDTAAKDTIIDALVNMFTNG
jgi:hypothetical protein